MILRFLFLVFFFYLLYKFIFQFVIPIYRTTKQVKRGFREMQEKMYQQNMNGGSPDPEPKSKKSPPGDYIEFEEVKE